MDFLKAEIARKRKQIEEQNLMKDPKKKFFKRSELSARQTEEYWKKHGNVVRPTYSTQVSEGDSSTSGGSGGKAEKAAVLPRKEVIKKLREIEEPIRLFGEDDLDSYNRLKKLETREAQFKGEGFSNEFQAAMAKVDQDYLNEVIKSSGGGDEKQGVEVKVKDDGTTAEDLKKMREELGKGSTDKDHEILLRWFKYLLKTWGDFLNVRETDTKRTIKGKMASATHSQTVTYLKPLFRKFKHKSVDAGLLGSLVEIVQFMMDRNYIRAHDVYLELAIGNAPWPIGVTMVGIHARTGREKISSRYVGHVLNDETQRKYIQAVKRLMTQSQIMFPTDPSRSYNFQKLKT